MAVIDAKSTTLTCNAQTVGNVLTYQFFRGVAREANHRPLNGDMVSLPSTPDYGRCVLNLYRDDADLGQIELESTLKNKTVVEFVITFANGNVDKFKGYCTTFQVTGTKQTAGDVRVMAVAEVRISGPTY